MFSDKDMEKMFLAGMEWERRRIQPVGLKEAIASALAKIEAAQQSVQKLTADVKMMRLSMMTRPVNVEIAESRFAANTSSRLCGEGTYESPAPIG